MDISQAQLSPLFDTWAASIIECPGIPVCIEFDSIGNLWVAGAKVGIKSFSLHANSAEETTDANLLSENLPGMSTCSPHPNL
jgi:hypothetical protein